jgi:hypothetical protein
MLNHQLIGNETTIRGFKNSYYVKHRDAADTSEVNGERLRVF